MFTVMPEAKPLLKKKDLEKLGELCVYLRVLEVYSNYDDIRIAEITKASRRLIEKLNDIFYLSIRPYTYQIVYKGQDYLLDVLAEKIDIKRW